jgi:hypothetical protein
MHVTEGFKLAATESSTFGCAVSRGIGAVFARNGVASGFPDLVCVDKEFSTSFFRKTPL